MGTYPLDGDFVASAVNDSCPGPSGPAAEKKIKTAAEEVWNCGEIKDRGRAFEAELVIFCGCQRERKSRKSV